MGTILVTGGCGFIGSNFIRHIIKNYDYNIINIDNITYAGNEENLNDIKKNKRYLLYKKNINNRSFICSILAKHKVKYIVHFAAESHVDKSILYPSIFIETNILGTHSLLECARKNNVEKIICVSTDEVYGSLCEKGFFTEKTNLAPNNPYSASKGAGDLIARAYYKTYGLPIITTRCSNNYGPYQMPEKLIPLMIYNALHNRPLTVHGDGMYIRDWLHVEDHCSAISKVLHNGKIGDVYNIGGNNEWYNIDIIKLILDKMDKPKKIIKYVKNRVSQDRRYAIDATKIKNELGWKPKIKFNDGIKTTIDWYLNNKEWLENAKNQLNKKTGVSSGK